MISPASLGCSPAPGEPAEATAAATAAQSESPAASQQRAAREVTVPRYVVLEGPGAIASLPEGLDPSSPAGGKLVAANAAKLRAQHAPLIARLQALGYVP